MKTGKLIFSFIILSLILVCSFGFAKTKINRIQSDEYEIIFDTLQNDSIRILQVTDLHLGNRGSWDKDFSVMRRIKKYVGEYNPEIIIITGDLFTGMQKESKEGLFMFAAQAFDDMERPWLYVFGNHCPEKTGREPIRHIFNDSEWGIIGCHHSENASVKHDYKVDLKVKGKDQPLWEVYAFDSGSEEGNRSIKKEQIRWYQRKSDSSKVINKQIIPAVSIFHIPLIQYKMLWEDDAYTKRGEFHEKVCYDEDDGTVYEAFLKQGNIKACFCGHDHDNNYWGKYKGGILLVYGHVSGESCYQNHWPPGAKLIKLPVKKGEIDIKDLVDISH